MADTTKYDTKNTASGVMAHGFGFGRVLPSDIVLFSIYYPFTFFALLIFIYCGVKNTHKKTRLFTGGFVNLKIVGFLYLLPVPYGGVSKHRYHDEHHHRVGEPPYFLGGNTL
jgi:hypothetical protein